ncbi:CDP-glucose 4,6-dehydratase [Alphaproteobacteria bacterium]|nr:CDP-glucose 4,6-dehydratase [Alphaproteobacteria bacterium]
MFKRNIYEGKTVLITGHTGFKGSWLSIWLSKLGAKVVGASIDIVSNPSNYLASRIKRILDDRRIDITDLNTVKSLISEVQPDFIFHLAAQPLVRFSYGKPIETFQINAIGSANILEASRLVDRKVTVIMITSDKAYDNVEWVWGYRETDRLGGKDPYSASKGMAEIVIRSYVESFFKKPGSNVRVGIARAGNVIGGGDWATDRLLPDCMEAWANGKVVDIRSPNATRPWQHVLEPLSGYLCLAENLYLDEQYSGEAYNFGPSSDYNYSVKSLIDEMSKHWTKIKWNDVSDCCEHLHEAGLLKLNCDKALHDLDWKSTLEFKDTVAFTVDWYKQFYKNRDQSMYSFTVNQIENYIKISNLKKNPSIGND